MKKIFMSAFSLTILFMSQAYASAEYHYVSVGINETTQPYLVKRTDNQQASCTLGDYTIASIKVKNDKGPDSTLLYKFYFTGLKKGKWTLFSCHKGDPTGIEIVSGKITVLPSSSSKPNVGKVK